MKMTWKLPRPGHYSLFAGKDVVGEIYAARWQQTRWVFWVWIAWRDRKQFRGWNSQLADAKDAVLNAYSEAPHA
jgi:hypothetical protein